MARFKGWHQHRVEVLAIDLKGPPQVLQTASSLVEGTTSAVFGQCRLQSAPQISDPQARATEATARAQLLGRKKPTGALPEHSPFRLFLVSRNSSRACLQEVGTAAVPTFVRGLGLL